MDDTPYTGDLDLSAVNTRDALAALLRTVHVRADKPSLRTLEARTRHSANPLSKTAVAEMLRGVRFPRKTMMVAYLRACGVQDDDMESWRRAWERVAATEEGPSQHRAVQAALGTESAFLAELDASLDRAEGQEERLPLLDLFQDVARALRARLARDAEGAPTGWPRDLREPSGKATASSTAYGIKAMLLLEDGLAADLIPVAKNLRLMAFPGGGQAGRVQSRPTPEITAVILSTLRRVSATEDFNPHLAQMEGDLGDYERCRPFILTMMLEASLLFDPGTRLCETLVDSLLAARRPYRDLLLWPEKAEPSLVHPTPSVAHTARAVRLLANVQAVRPASQVQEALEQAVAWLLEQGNLHDAYEIRERPTSGRPEMVYVRHFTAAWVVKALISAGVPATHPSVSDAVAQIRDSYGGDTVALWAWHNGDLPNWMTFDAIEALRLVHLASPAWPNHSLPQLFAGWNEVSSASTSNTG